jgi:hypothetical protein
LMTKEQAMNCLNPVVLTDPEHFKALFSQKIA